MMIRVIEVCKQNRISIIYDWERLMRFAGKQMVIDFSNNNNYTFDIFQSVRNILLEMDKLLLTLHNDSQQDKNYLIGRYLL